MRKSLLITALVLILAFMIFGATSAFAAEEIIGGDCGANAKWSLDSEGVLTISGTGNITDYSYGADTTPWYELKDAIGKIVVSEGITYIGSYDFAGLTSVTEVSLPSTSLRRIGLNSFQGCTALKSIQFPDCLEEISSYAFRDCTSLEQAIIPDSVTKFQDSVFSGCKALTKVVLPESITVISGNTFYNCTALKDVTLGTKITEIKGSAFYNCQSLEKLDLKGRDSLKSIASGAFKNCKALKETIDGILSFPDSLESIGSGAFESCTSIENVLLPNYVSLGSTVFRYDTGIKNAVLPQSMTVIPDDIFYGCTSLEQVELPHAVEKIGNSAFMLCKSLTLCDIPDTLREFSQYCFDGCESLPKINIPDGVKVLPNAAFVNMKALTNVYIPDSVETIETNAFASCEGLERIIIPRSVTDIGSGAFSSCVSAKCIVIPNKDTKVTSMSFMYAAGSNCTYIPVVIAKDAACEEYFRANRFNNIIYIDADFDFYTHTCDYMDYITPSENKDGNIKHMCKYCGEIVSETVIPMVKTVKIDPWKVPYDGTLKTPTVTIYDRNGDPIGPENYDVTYPEDAIKIGKYEATITYKNLYAGTDDTRYYIVGDLSKKSSKVSVTSISNKVYTGSAIMPEPTVKAVGVDGTVVKLVKGTDYELEYSNNFSIGKATVSIEGKGNYMGIKKVTFKILPKKVTGLKLTSPKSKQLKVAYAKSPGGVKYKVAYRVKGTTSWKTVTVTGTSKLIKSLKGGKTYQVRVKAFKTVNGTNYEGAWTAIKSLKVKK
ncbi:MAG: leucine-rich repeat protein [Clostridiales bacterium]|nr:leucine-rich repeat protein [Clostridiales bacterium]